MADLISFQTGDFTAANWKAAIAAATQRTRSASTNTTTTSVYNATGFSIADGTVMEGILFFCKRVNTTGTVTVGLLGSGSGTPIREVTVNASDLPAVEGWVFFRFATTYTAAGAQTYKVGIKGDTTGNATFYRSATLADWARFIRGTTAVSPAAADNIYIVGEWTAPATVAAITITMDQTSGATIYGDDNATTSAFAIGHSGTMTYKTTVSTYLKLNTILSVFPGGTLNIGTVGTPIPSANTAILEFDSVSAGQWGLENRGGTVNMYGDIGSKVVKAKLAADAAASATSIVTDVTTNWASGDQIAIASTTRAATQTTQNDSRTVSSSSGTTVNVPALTNAHGGVAPIIAEVIMLTRNVKIRGLNATTGTGYVYSDINGTVNCNYVEFTFIGANTLTKYGVHCDANATLAYCSMHTGTNANAASYYTNSAAADNVLISYCVAYGMYMGMIVAAATSGTTLQFDNCVIIGTTNGNNFSSLDLGWTITNCTAAGCSGIGFSIDETAATHTGTFSGNVAHSCTAAGLNITGANCESVTFTNCSSWRNNGSGLSISATSLNMLLDTITLFANLTQNISVAGDQFLPVYRNIVADGSAAFATTIGISFASASNMYGARMFNCNFGSTFTHSTTDFQFAGTTSIMQMRLDNVALASTPEFNPYTSTTCEINSYMKATHHDQLANNHFTFYVYGTVGTDIVNFRTATPAERLTPTSLPTTSRLKIESAPKFIALLNGTSTTVSAWVRTSVVGDGAAHNGSRARLMLRANPALGIMNDTVLDTATASSDGAFESLSAVTPAVSQDGVLEVYVDTNGTAGYVTVDDWAVT